MKPKKGKLYTIELKWNANPAEISSGIAVWNRSFLLDSPIGQALVVRGLVGRIEYNKDIFIFLEDGVNVIGQRNLKILTSDGVVGYIVPNFDICSMKPVK